MEQITDPSTETSPEDDLVIQKVIIITKLRELVELGETLSRNYNMESDLASMESEYQSVRVQRMKRRCLEQLSRGPLTFMSMCFPDRSEGVESLLRFCLREDPIQRETMVLVGLCHRQRQTVEDDVVALDWFTKSAQLGSPVGIFHLAECYARDQDRREFKWWRNSLYAGLPVPIADSPPTSPTHKGKGCGIAEDPELSLLWYMRSAELGCSEAMIRIGNCHRDGYGTKQDMDVAIGWYYRAMGHGKATDAVARTKVTELLCAREADDPFAGIRYHADTHLDATDPDMEGVSRELLTESLNRKGGTAVDIALRWRRAEREVTRLRAEVEALRTQNEELRTEIDYRPGGPGYTEAEADFLGQALWLA